MSRKLKIYLLIAFSFLFSIFLLSCNHTHYYYSKTVIEEPTCSSTGKAYLVCDCGDAIEEILPALSHDFEDATCTLPKTCKVCHATEGEANGHTEQATTCNGTECSVCKAVIKEPNHELSFISETASTLLTEGKRVEKCTICDVEVTTTLDVIDPLTLDMPVVYLSDYLEGQTPITQLTKSKGYISVKYKYVSNDPSIESFDCYSQIKVQGHSSSNFPKKNFTVKFYKDDTFESKFKVNFGWGKESKYCMKANWIDSSYVRNIVGAQIFSQMVETREDANSMLLNAPNNGVIDGYPILVYVNGEFHGVYTMNIPKDEWAFAMTEEPTTKEAMLMSKGWLDSNKLLSPIGANERENWEIEYCSTEDTAWVFESFNELVELINCGDNERIKEELPNHLDINAAIDNFIFTYFINAADNTGKNILWITYDGKVWIPSMYDMDGTFGAYPDGRPIGDEYPIYPQIWGDGGWYTPQCKLYSVLVGCYSDQMLARYKFLRQEILTIENVEAHFEAIFALIPEQAREADQEKWPKIPYYNENLENIYSSTENQIARLDNFFNRFFLLKK